MKSKNIYSPIIPVNQVFYNQESAEVVNWNNNLKDLEIDWKALTVFCALGFMLDDQTFYKNIKTCRPATKYKLNNNTILSSEQYWKWNYNPKDRKFSDILDEFTIILENIIKSETKNKSILLPISGGLDSRTLFVPVKERKDLTLSSYEFENGFHESDTSIKLSNQYKIPLYVKTIPKGYLWNKLDQIHKLNNCFTDFTHPRQVAAINDWIGLGDSVLLGHWGDVLFDKQADSKNISYNEQVIQLKKKIIKPSGIELATDLWEYWGLEGSFESYITNRLDKLYGDIDIDHPSARMRAFKSLYWAPRWTSINLSIFNKAGEIVLPYYSDEMCKFICGVSEDFLAGRKIQIEYIKQNCAELASLPWQKYYPLNLFQYHWFDNPVYFPVRAMRKIKRIMMQKMHQTPDLITRNWELQFLGGKNELHLRENLLNSDRINEIIPKSIIKKYLEKFRINPVKYSHPVSMLLTIAVFMDWHKQK